MPLYHDHNMPDDPYRTAPPYQAPGEIEPPDAPQVSDREAVERVAAVLETGHGVAFGDTAAQWEDVLIDYLATYQARALLFALLDLREMYHIRRAVEIFIADTANNWLAEADADELEREGFQP